MAALKTQPLKAGCYSLSSRQDSFQSTYPSLSSHGLVNAVSLFASQGHICLATQRED